MWTFRRWGWKSKSNVNKILPSLGCPRARPGCRKRDHTTLSPTRVRPRRGACSADTIEVDLNLMHVWICLAVDISEMRSKQWVLC